MQDSIHLEDALGRVMSLLYDHFCHWPVMEARLRSAFSGLLGERKVLRNEYQLLLGHAYSQVTVDEENWVRSVFPGSRLFMSMLFENPWLNEELCPRCMAQCGRSKSGAWIECKQCNLNYRQFVVENATNPKQHAGQKLSSYREVLEDMFGTGLQQNTD